MLKSEGNGTVEEVDRQFEITFPGSDDHNQDEEFCEVRVDGDTRRIRFHDYDEIYSIPGLYEQLFYEELKCSSPAVICSMLTDLAEQGEVDLPGMRVLDVGAGNGIVGETLKQAGAGAVMGVDILPEAELALERDRPGIYDGYLTGDLTDLSAEELRELADWRPNALTCVAALGFDDIPPDAFAAAAETIEPGGLLGLCIKDEFVGNADPSGFSELIRSNLEGGALVMEAERKYRHRLSAAGEPLHYVALIASKRSELVHESGAD